MSTSEGCPVAMDIWLALRPMEVASALKLVAEWANSASKDSEVRRC